MKFKIYSIALMAFIFSFVMFVPAAKASDYRSGANLNITKNDYVDSSLTTAAGKQLVDGVINGNFYCTGQDVVITGVVSGNVFCAAQSFKLSGRIDGDLFVTGQNVEISGVINGSISAFSSSIRLTETAKLRQDLSAFVGNANINGIIARDVNLSANTAKIGATIGRNLNGSYGNLTLTGDAFVRGNLNYKSATNATIDNGAKIEGKINRQSMPLGSLGGFIAGLLGYLGALLSLLIVSLTTVLIFPNFYEKSYDEINSKLGSTVGWGFFNLLIVPFVIALIMVTVIGIPLAGLVAIAWILSLMLSGPVFAYYIGKKVKKKSSPVVTMLIGSLIVLGMYIVPILNIIVAAVVAVVGSGSILNLFKSSKLQIKSHK